MVLSDVILPKILMAAFYCLKEEGRNEINWKKNKKYTKKEKNIRNRLRKEERKKERKK